MNKLVNNPGDISKENRKILLSKWEEHYDQSNTPGTYFNSLDRDIIIDFYEKLEIQCKQILKNGYKQWAYKKYRFDHNGEQGVLELTNDVKAWLLKSSDRESFVNLKEIFKNGEEKINRNIRQTIKRVLADHRDETKIDRLLRRIEDIADDDSNDIIRNRTEKNKKADYFTIANKIPEERDPTNEEIEHVISLVGNFKEHPQRQNAKQATKVYSTKQLIEMMEIISNNLPTDVTPNTLETIFIDLIPDFLPPDFLIEKAFKIYGNVNFPIDIDHKLSLNDLDQGDQLVAEQAAESCVEKINKLGIRDHCKIIKKHIDDKNLNINSLAKEEIFDSREHVEEVMNKIGRVTNDLFSTIEGDEVSEIAFSLFFEKV